MSNPEFSAVDRQTFLSINSSWRLHIHRAKGKRRRVAYVIEVLDRDNHELPFMALEMDHMNGKRLVAALELALT